jgi:hypothetical protein
MTFSQRVRSFVLAALTLLLVLILVGGTVAFLANEESGCEAQSENSFKEMQRESDEYVGILEYDRSRSEYIAAVCS